MPADGDGASVPCHWPSSDFLWSRSIQYSGKVPSEYRLKLSDSQGLVDSGSTQARPVDGAEKPLRNDLTGSSL